MGKRFFPRFQPSQKVLEKSLLRVHARVQARDPGSIKNHRLLGVF